MEIITGNKPQHVSMERVVEYLRTQITKIDGSRFKIDIYQQDVPEMLAECYKAECKKRGCEAIIDTDTQSHIDKVSQWLTCGERTGLMMVGSVGNGKTTMTRAIQTLIAMLYGAPGNNFKKLEVVSAMDMAKMAAESQDQFERIKQAKLLAIDDVGTEEVAVRNYGNVLSPLTDILYYRYDKRMFTILSTNLDLDSIPRRYGDRIGDRFKEMFSIVSFTNKSYRK